MAENLLFPCPFCGARPQHGLGKVLHDQLHGDPYQQYRVWCPSCGGYGYSGADVRVECIDKERAFAKWNQRVPARASDEPLATQLPYDFLASVRRLCVAARTTGGVAGRDEGLCASLERVEAMLQAIADQDWQAGVAGKFRMPPVETDEPDAKPVASPKFAKEMERNIDRLRGALRVFVNAAQSWHEFHHGSETVQCDAICEAIPRGLAALDGLPRPSDPSPTGALYFADQLDIAADLSDLERGELADMLRALLAFPEDWETRIAVAYNEFSHGERQGLERAAAELRRVLGMPGDDHGNL